MSEGSLGEHAIVIGAGVAGLTAAGALAPHYSRVTILERDALPEDAVPRAGIPQGKHFHALLAGGFEAMCEVYEGFAADLEARGAVPLTVGYDMRMERSEDLAFEPRRDLGIHTYCLSRPLLEDCLRRRAMALPNVVVEAGVHVERLLSDDAGRVVGVKIRGEAERQADLVVDASGRGQPTLALIKQLGMDAPPASEVGVDVHYASATFELPDGIEGGFKGVMTLPTPTSAPRGALMSVMEGGRYILALGGGGDDLVPSDDEGYMQWIKGLRTDTIYKAVSAGRRVTKIQRYNFTGSYHRHFNRMPTFPAGLIPIGDSLCRLNPVYGQGMSLAARQVRGLASALSKVRSGAMELADMPSAFFASADEAIEVAWSMSAIPDLVNPAAVGERPPDLMDRLIFLWALSQLARKDEALHRLVAEVSSLLKPMSAYEPVADRVTAFIAEQKG